MTRQERSIAVVAVLAAASWVVGAWSIPLAAALVAATVAVAVRTIVPSRAVGQLEDPVAAAERAVARHAPQADVVELHAELAELRERVAEQDRLTAEAVRRITETRP